MVKYHVTIKEPSSVLKQKWQNGGREGIRRERRREGEEGEQGEEDKRGEKHSPNLSKSFVTVTGKGYAQNLSHFQPAVCLIPATTSPHKLPV